MKHFSLHANLQPMIKRWRPSPAQQRMLRLLKRTAVQSPDEGKPVELRKEDESCGLNGKIQMDTPSRKSSPPATADESAVIAECLTVLSEPTADLAAKHAAFKRIKAHILSGVIQIESTPKEVLTIKQNRQKELQKQKSPSTSEPDHARYKSYEVNWNPRQSNNGPDQGMRLQSPRWEFPDFQIVPHVGQRTPTCALRSPVPSQAQDHDQSFETAPVAVPNLWQSWLNRVQDD